MLPILEPDLSPLERKYVNECFDDKWISSSGKFVSLFEENFTNSLLKADMKALAVSNGTVALQLALLSSGIGPGDEVIVPDLTFAATINAVLHVGAKPIIADVNAKSWNMDVQSIQSLVTHNTKAIIFVHLFGSTLGIHSISKFCSERNLILIEDCAEALGSKFENRSAGTFGDIATFSFFGNKTLTTGEGGLLAFKSMQAYERAIILRDHGMSKTKRYWHEVIGYNMRMTNLQAAVGVAQLERRHIIFKKKKLITDNYLKSVNAMKVSWQNRSINDIMWLNTIVVERKIKEKIKSVLIKNDIETRDVFFPLSSMPIYQKYALTEMTNSKFISECGISIPSSSVLSKQQTHFISNLINEVLH